MCFVFILFVYLYCVNDDTLKLKKNEQRKSIRSCQRSTRR